VIEGIVAPTGIAPIAGVALPAATPAAGGHIVGIAVNGSSEDVGTGGPAPAGGRPATDIDHGNHPVNGNGAADHGGDTDPNRGSFM
jgi:hypothetical protein